jgi:hypothetical protein
MDGRSTAVNLFRKLGSRRFPARHTAARLGNPAGAGY